METVLLVLLALTTTVAAVELVRREVVVLRLGTPWWRLDAQAVGALYASVTAVVLWVMVATKSHPPSLAPLILWLGVALFLLGSERTVERS
jgi:hypothetical protein